MNKLKIQTEILQIAMYCKIILEIIGKHDNLSIIKVTFYAFIVKQKEFDLKPVYSASDSRDLVLKSISLISGEYKNYCESLRYSIKAIHLLIKQGAITIEQDKIVFQNNFYFETKKCLPSKFLDSAIKASKMISDKQFIKEVIQNV